MTKRAWILVLGSVVVLGPLAFLALSDLGDPPIAQYAVNPDDIKFRDEVSSGNTSVTSGQLELAFVDSQGRPVDLKQYRGKKNVVLVVTRGFNGYICPYCTAQTSRLIRNYDEFRKRDAEVLVVYPGPSQGVPEFVRAVQAQAGAAIPFPLLLDEESRAVDQLQIRADLAKPSTYVLDRQGQVRFAYVGTTVVDRPSVKAVLKQLDALAADRPPAEESAESGPGT